MIKKRAIAGVLCMGTMIFAVFFLCRDDPRHEAIQVASPSHPVEDPSSISHQHEEIFQRAFWRRPRPEDRIFHAERREWDDSEGLKKWQWFIKVQASTELMRFLREDNPFGMTRAAFLPCLKDQPSWFSPNHDHFDTFVSKQGDLVMSFSRDDRVIFATDRGFGFRAGAPEPARVDTVLSGDQNPLSRRLPDALPPTNNTQSR